MSTAQAQQSPQKIAFRAVGAVEPDQQAVNTGGETEERDHLIGHYGVEPVLHFRQAEKNEACTAGDDPTASFSQQDDQHGCGTGRCEGGNHQGLSPSDPEDKEGQGRDDVVKGRPIPDGEKRVMAVIVAGETHWRRRQPGGKIVPNHHGADEMRRLIGVCVKCGIPGYRGMLNEQAQRQEEDRQADCGRGIDASDRIPQPL